MDDRAAAQAFEEKLAAMIPGVLRPVRQDDGRDESIHIAEQLRDLGSDWGRQTSPALQHEVASMAERASGEPRVASNPLAGGRVLRSSLAMTAAATLLIVAIPAARASVARQLHRVLDAFVVGPNTEVVRPDSLTAAEKSATRQQFDRRLAAGETWHFSTGYGVGYGGRVPPGASPTLQPIDRLDDLHSLTSMPIQHPTVPHRGTVPAFDHAVLAPGGVLFLFFGSGSDELFLAQALVAQGPITHSRVICCWDEPGKFSYSPPLKTEELFVDGQRVVWDPDNTGLIPDSSALRWEREGVSFSLLGRGLTREEAVKVFSSLQPVDAHRPK